MECQLSYKSLFSKRVNRLGELLDQLDPGWEKIDEDLLVRAKPDKMSRVLALVNWQASAVAARDRWPGIGMNPIHDFRHLDLLLGRLAWKTPLPNHVAELFVVRPWPSIPAIQCFGKAVGDELRGLLEKVKLDDVLRLYRMNNLLSANFRAYHQQVKSAIAALHTQHPIGACKCDWSITSSGEWVRLSSGVIYGLRYFGCPYRVALEELQHEWIETFPKDWSSYEFVSCWYDRTASFFVENGLATSGGGRQGPEDGRIFPATRGLPILEFTWSSQLTEVFDAVLSKTVEANIQNLDHWLAGIDGGQRPWKREVFPENSVLGWNENDELELVVWPIGIGRPFGDEATTSWRQGIKKRP